MFKKLLQKPSRFILDIIEILFVTITLPIRLGVIKFYIWFVWNFLLRLTASTLFIISASIFLIFLLINIIRITLIIPNNILRQYTD